MNIYALTAGILSAIAVVSLFRSWRLEGTRWAYPVLLAEFPVNYWAFAIHGSDATALRLEILVGAAFVAVACIAYRARSFATLMVLAAGYVMHAAYDFSHDLFFVNAGEPAWWPEYCASVDVLIGLYIVYLAFACRREPATA